MTEGGREVARLTPSGPADSPIARLVAERGATMPRADLLALARSSKLRPAVGPRPASRSSRNSVKSGYSCPACLSGQLIPLDDAVLEATSIDPKRLRSLDALHLATALSVREEIGAFVTYDRRLAEAAAANRLNVVCPA